MSNGDSTAITAGDLNTELSNQGAFASGSNPITVTFNDSKRQYTINSNGTIEYAGIKSDDEDSNIQLSIISTETESRAMILKVTATVASPTSEELQVKSELELQNMFAQACTNFWEDEEYTWESIVEYIYEDFGTTITTASQAYEYWEEYFEEDGLTGCSNVYDFIIQTYGGNIKCKFTCTGNDDVTGTGAEFIVRNPNPKITATTTNGDYLEKVWNEYPNSKIETFSDIQTSNYTLKKDDYDVIIPAGFAYGTSSNVGTVATGLVITDSVDENGYSNGNEFVWIPVDKTNLTVGKTDKKMAEISSETDYKGILYNLELDPTGNTIIDTEAYNPNLPENAHEATSNVYGIEPSSKWYADASNGVTQTSMQNDYNAMIASVKKYGGFYVARYEMGNNDISKLGVMPISSYMNEANGWYGLYSKAKTYTNPNNYNSVTSSMIWGSQYDAMLIFSLNNSVDSSKITANTNGNHSGSVLPTGLYEGTDSINNIYDLEGNMWEFTQENQYNGNRSLRGGYIHDSWFHPVSRQGRIPGFNYAQTDSTRVMLYINI